ncbi:MAG: hypothetical protein KKB50_16470 [Planctomycetes bacterium]|nr:hypothetical protein [Planctomycetota bacterium]
MGGSIAREAAGDAPGLGLVTQDELLKGRQVAGADAQHQRLIAGRRPRTGLCEIGGHPADRNRRGAVCHPPDR